MAQSASFFRDGFQLREYNFTLSQSRIGLDPTAQRSLPLYICDVFVRHKLSISNIERVLDEDYRTIVQALIENGILYDRRQMAGQPPVGFERRISQRKDNALGSSPH